MDWTGNVNSLTTHSYFKQKTGTEKPIKNLQTSGLFEKGK